MWLFSKIDISGLIVDKTLVPAENGKMISGSELKKLCSDPDEKSARVMINVIKHNPDNKADIDQYSEKVVFGLFPKIGSYIFHAGAPIGDYWDQVNILS